MLRQAQKFHDNWSTLKQVIALWIFGNFRPKLLYVGWENGTENVIILVFFLWYEYINLRCVGASVRAGKKASFKSSLVDRVRSYYRQASVCRIQF